MGDSRSLSPFLDGARELSEKLKACRDPVGFGLLVRAEALVREFASWASVPPEGGRKSEAISELIDLTREANEHLVWAGNVPG
jgi:hypothetical protein